MWKSIKKRVNHSAQFAGVELLLNETGWQAHLCILEKKKDKLELIRQVSGIQSLDELKAELPASVPIHLTINGRGVLHREVPLGNNDHLRSVLPNANASEFQIQVIKEQAHCFVSVIRENLVTELLTTFQQEGLWVTQLSLGPWDVRFLLPFLNQKKTIYTEQQQLTFQGEHLLSFSNNTPDQLEEIQLGDHSFSSAQLVSYAGAFKGLLAIDEGLSLPIIEQVREDYFYKNLSQKGGIAMVISLFVILLFNTAFYYHYKSSNQQLSSELLYKKAQLEDLSKLKKEVRQQESFLHHTNINQNSRASYYADMIGRSFPEGMTLTALSIFPIQGKAGDYNEKELVLYQNKKIKIKGLCKSSLTYNQWLKFLEAEKWTQQVQHLTYKDLNTKLGEFELALTLSPSE